MTTGWGRIGLALATAGAVASMAMAQVSGDAEEAKALGMRAFAENCLMCHSAEMSNRQRLTAKQWTTEVEKMIGWGAPVPPEQKGVLVGYLAGTFSEKIPPPAPDLARPEELLAEGAALARRPAPHGDAARGAAPYARHCATCHGPEGQGADLGPRLAGRPVLLDEARYREVVGKGLRKMPGFASALLPDAGDDTLAWLRGR